MSAQQGQAPASAGGNYVGQPTASPAAPAPAATGAGGTTGGGAMSNQNLNQIVSLAAALMRLVLARSASTGLCL